MSVYELQATDMAQENFAAEVGRKGEFS